MTEPTPTPNEMPDWPRLLSRQWAAAYLGVSPGHFDNHVRKAVQPVKLGKRCLYDRLNLDQFVDNLSGTGKSRVWRASQCELD